MDSKNGTKNVYIAPDGTKKVHCTPFCPKCGSDLYYFENECICKNKECNWTCGGCQDE